MSVGVCRGIILLRWFQECGCVSKGVFSVTEVTPYIW